MPNILIVDTATRSATLALGESRAFTLRVSDPEERNSRDLLLLVQSLFEQTGGLANAHLDALAYNAGPGSYTGSRIAASVVQGIAFAKGLPAIALNTFELLRLRAQREAGIAGGVACMAVVESKVDEYFWCQYGGVALSQQSPAMCVGKAAELREAVISFQGVVVVNQTVQSHPVATDLNGALWMQPRASDAFGLVEERLAAGDTQTAFEVEPLYGQDNIGWLTLAEQRARS